MAGAKLRGTAAGLVLEFSGDETPEEAAESLEAVLAEKRDFLSGAAVALDCGQIRFSREQAGALIELCRCQGVAVRALISADEQVSELAADLGLVERQPKVARVRLSTGVQSDVTSPEIVESECGLVTGTVRGGHAIAHPGSVIVFGDVNAGAEIVAGGSVVVWGALRGTVHAGASGDDGAVVCSLGLEPMQLRIGNCIARSPDEPSPRRGPEMARLRDGAIEVEAWPARRPPRPLAEGGRLARAVRALLERLPKGVGPWGAS